MEEKAGYMKQETNYGNYRHKRKYGEEIKEAQDVNLQLEEETT